MYYNYVARYIACSNKRFVVVEGGLNLPTCVLSCAFPDHSRPPKTMRKLVTNVFGDIVTVYPNKKDDYFKDSHSTASNRNSMCACAVAVGGVFGAIAHAHEINSNHLLGV